MLTWAHTRQARLTLIEPGKPNQNAYIVKYLAYIYPFILRVLPYLMINLNTQLVKKRSQILLLHIQII